MRQFAILVSAVSVVLVGLLAYGRVGPATVAQEGTPPAEEFAPEGVTFEPLGFGTAEELPAAPADLLLARFTIEPGAGFPVEADEGGGEAAHGPAIVPPAAALGAGSGPFALPGVGW